MNQKQPLTKELYLLGQGMSSLTSVTCCVEDASVYGLLVKGNVATLPKDKWIQVMGTIDQLQYDGDSIPIIKIQHYKLIPVPEQPYVYDVGIKIK
jgi:putative membrane protein